MAYQSNNWSSLIPPFYNMPLSIGEFPDNLKIAKVIPVYKIADTSIFSNYRPISILPCFSKLSGKSAFWLLFVGNLLKFVLSWYLKSAQRHRALILMYKERRIRRDKRAWAWSLNQFWFDNLLQGIYVDEWLNEYFRQCHQGNFRFHSTV